MASATQVRRIALGLDGTSEAPHFERTAFKVARIYATLAADGRSINLGLKPDEQEFKCMAAPDIFTPVPGGWGRQGWTTVSLAKIGVAELKQSLEMAWRHALPKSRVTKTQATKVQTPKTRAPKANKRQQS
jgi:hypothetical protein